MSAPLPAPGGSLVLLRERAKLGSVVYFDLRAWGRKQQNIPWLSSGAKVEGGESGRA